MSVTEIYMYSSSTGEFLQKGELSPKSVVPVIDEEYLRNSANAILPPVSMSTLTSYINRCSTHRACIEARAKCYAGNGYEFYGKDSLTKEQVKNLEDFASNVNYDNETLYDVVLRAAYMFTVYDNAYFEVIKTKNGDMSIYNMNPNYTFVVPKSNMTGIDHYVYYNELTPTSANNDIRLFPMRGGELSAGRKYCYHIKSLSNFTSDFYGIPSYMSAIDSIEGSYIVDSYNTNFFKNNARFDYMIITTGVILGSSEKQAIKDALSSNIGVDNQHKSMHLDLGDDGKVEIRELNRITDGSFLQMKEFYKDQIIEAHDLTAELIGRSSGQASLSGNDSIGALKTINERHIKPTQKMLSTHINRLLQMLLGFNPEFVLKPIQVLDAKTESIIRLNDVKAGIVSPRYFRRKNYPDMSNEEISATEELFDLLYKNTGNDKDPIGRVNNDVRIGTYDDQNIDESTIN